jgi:hypothetical protein
VTEGVAHGVSGNSASPEGIGVSGWASATTGSPYGVYGKCESPHGYGVYGHAESTDGYAVYCAGNFAASGAKSTVVKTSQGPTLMYCQESPENWFEDAGEGMLVEGRARVELDPLFLETVTIDEANPMKVFVEVENELCAGVAIRRGATGFSLTERLGGRSSGAFWYRVMAKRKGFEGKRLDVCEAGRADSYLYPELREKELQEIQGERAGMASELAQRELERTRHDEEMQARREPTEEARRQRALNNGQSEEGRRTLKRGGQPESGS